MTRQAIVEVLAQVLAVEEGTVDDSFGPRSCKSWDSLRHVQIVLALEDRFGCTFEPGDLPRLISVATIAEVLAEKGVA
jgi:acyl carrier protein